MARYYADESPSSISDEYDPTVGSIGHSIAVCHPHVSGMIKGCLQRCQLCPLQIVKFIPVSQVKVVAVHARLHSLTFELNQQDFAGFLLSYTGDLVVEAIGGAGSGQV